MSHFARSCGHCRPLPSPTATAGCREHRAMYLDPGEKDTHDTWVAGLADSLDKDEAAFKTGVLSLSYAPIRA